jgi:hypothetical protein
VTLTGIEWACDCGTRWSEVHVEGEPEPTPDACPSCGTRVRA